MFVMFNRQDRISYHLIRVVLVESLISLLPILRFVTSDLDSGWRHRGLRDNEEGWAEMSTLPDGVSHYARTLLLAAFLASK